MRQYELKDHLGNIRATVSDKKTDTGEAEVQTASNYYPFGAIMPGRNFNSGDYRYGFNGKERDSEGLGGGGSTYDYGFRIYNPWLGKFLSVDPLTAEYAELSTYQFASNTPIQAIDLDGLERFDINQPFVPASDRLYNWTLGPQYKTPAKPQPRAEEIIPTQTFIGPNNNTQTPKQRADQLSAMQKQKNFEKLKSSVTKENFLIGQGIGIGLSVAPPVPGGAVSGVLNYLKVGAQVGLLKSSIQVSAQVLLGNGNNLDKADVASTFLTNTLFRGNVASISDELLKSNFDYTRNFQTTLNGTKSFGNAAIEFGVGLGLKNLNFIPKPGLGQTTNTISQISNDVVVGASKSTVKTATKKLQP